ncbi:MAG: hypothetical protein R3C01_15290 [Planctomycetaceae bacterium]
MSIAVFKVGGSLLDLPDLVEKLQRVLALRAEQRRVLVVGGGALVDGVRIWSERFSLTDRVAHELALDAMGTTARLVACLLPTARLCSNEVECRVAWSHNQCPVVDCQSFLKPDLSIPIGWHVTSDSLSARVAVALGARELVLLKSINLPQQLGQTGEKSTSHNGHDTDVPAVDEWFFTASRGIPLVSWCCLRQSEIVISRWLDSKSE